MNTEKFCKDKKRITFILGSMGGGGAERVISILANHYAEKGWNVDILTLLDEKCSHHLYPSIDIISLANLSFTRIQQLPHWFFKIRNYCKVKKPEVVVSFIARVNIITILACIGLKQRIFVSERNDPAQDGRSLFVKMITNLLYTKAKRVIFQTKKAQSCFRKKAQHNSQIIYNPVIVTEKSKIQKNKKIVTIGRLTSQKNHILLIKAFKRIHDIFPDYTLHIYGEGKLRDKLLNKVEELSISDSFVLHGYTPNVHKEIADSEIFILSSDYEGLSNALLEAMIMGIPCISTDCAGSSEVIEDGVNGLLVPVGSEDKLFQAIISLITNKDLADRISEKSLLSASKFDFNTIIKQWEAVLES